MEYCMENDSMLKIEIKVENQGIMSLLAIVIT